MYTVSQKRALPEPLFYFLNKSVKNQPNLMFWYTKSWRNLMLKSYKLTYLAYKFLQHYLAKCKMNFKQHSTVISSNRWWFFSEMSKHAHNIHYPKTVKISLASQQCSQYSKCTDRKNHEVCIHHLISSSTMCCWNAIDLWNRYCCNSWQNEVTTFRTHSIL